MTSNLHYIQYKPVL